MKITRNQMIEAVRKNIEGREEVKSALGRHNSFAKWGNLSRLHTAEYLLKRLESGTIPTTQEVVGYFGKGARFSE